MKSLLQRLESFGLGLLRPLLNLWVKVTILPEPFKSLGLAQGNAVFYVLENDSQAALMVLQRVCQQHQLVSPEQVLRLNTITLPRSVCMLQRWRGFFLRRPAKRTVSADLSALLAAMQDTENSDVKIVPVSVFWGRAPDKERSFFKQLFADSWDRTGRIRQMFMIIAHGRDTWLQFSEPLSLRAFVAESRDLNSERQTRKLARVLRVHFRRQRAAAIGPELSDVHNLIAQILKTPAVRVAIEKEAKAKKISVARAEQRASRYAYEIAADTKYRLLVMLRGLLRRLWDRLYDGVEVGNIDVVKNLNPKQTVVYLPCHRSHIDYLLLSYVLFQQGLVVPRIAAGINLNIPVVGKVLRRGGAFYIRRSFKGNKLYSTVFHHYLSANLDRAVPMKYFIEGGRSRTGRTLAAKVGLLDMTVRSYLANPDRAIVLVPVYIGYEKLVEGRSYLAELRGVPKQKESFFGFLRSLRSLRSRFGKVHLNFGQPLEITAFLNHFHPDWHNTEYELEQRPNWLPALVDKLGLQIITRINAATALNPVSMLALVLLATPRHALDKEDLCQQLELYLLLAKRLPYSAWSTVTALSSTEIIEYGLDLELIEIQPHDLGDIVRATEKSADLLSYFHNNVLHTLIIAAVIACCFRSIRSLTRVQLLNSVKLIYPFIKAELFLQWQEDQLPDLVDDIIAVLLEQEILRGNSHELWRRSSLSAATMQIELLAQLVIHTFERYFITTTLLLREGSNNINQARLEQLCQLMAQRIAMLYSLRAPEFYDKTLFRQFLQTLQQLGILWRDEQGMLAFDQMLLLGYRDARYLLGVEVRHSILQLTKGIPELRDSGRTSE